MKIFIYFIFFKNRYNNTNAHANFQSVMSRYSLCKCHTALQARSWPLQAAGAADPGQCCSTAVTLDTGQMHCSLPHSIVPYQSAAAATLENRYVVGRLHSLTWIQTHIDIDIAYKPFIVQF